MSDKPLSVFLIFQGDESRAVCRELMERFGKRWKARAAGRPDIEFRSLIDEPKGLGRPWLDRVARHIRTCDLAVAVQAFDERKASAGTGNLWLELGMWLAERDPEDAFLACKQSEVQDVDPPSNLQLWTSCNFLEDDELDQELEKWFIERLPARGRDLPIDLNETVERVEETFGKPFADWLRQHASLCASAPWTSSLQLLSFNAELLRMGRSGRELADIAAHLRRVGKASLAVAMVGLAGREDGTEVPPKLDLGGLNRDVEELGVALGNLAVAASVLLKRHYPEPGTNDKPARRHWADLLQQYLRFRIEPSVAGEGKKPAVEEVAPFVGKMTELFRETHPDARPLSKGRRNPKDRKYATLTVALANGATEFGEMFHFSRDADAFAEHLEWLRVTWFERTSSAMKMHFQTFQPRPPARVMRSKIESLALPIDSLHILSGALPHRREDTWPIPIWRRKSAPPPGPQENGAISPERP